MGSLSFCKRIHTILIYLGILSTLESYPGLAAELIPQPATRGPVDQQLILLDTSSSMNVVIQRRRKIMWGRMGAEKYVAGLPLGAKVGLQTFGGSCGIASLLVPLDLDNRTRIRTALEHITPYGATPLAHALEQTAVAFDWRLEGRKEILIISDGGETCGGDVCQAVQALRQRSAEIRIDVAGLLLNKSARDQLSCITQLTGGTFMNLEANDLPRLGKVLLSLGSSILARIIAFLLGLGATITWTHLIHRALVSALSLGKGLAATLASLAGVAALSFFVTLLFHPVTPLLNLLPFSLVALGTGIVIAVCLFRQERSRGREITLSLFCTFVLLTAMPSPGYGKELQVPQQNTPVSTGRDHVMAIDQSGSMKPCWQRVKAWAGTYIATQVQNGDTFSLLAFTDRTTVLGAWRIEGAEDREEVQDRIDALRLVSRSYTVFSQLLSSIMQQLRAVARPDHEPVVRIVSDGKQSHPPGFQGKDVSFKAIGERTVNMAGGCSYIAVLGGTRFTSASWKSVSLLSSPASGEVAVLRQWKELFSPTLSRKGKDPVVVPLAPSFLGGWPAEALFLVNVTSSPTLPREGKLDAALVLGAEHSPVPPLRLSLRERSGTITGRIPVKEFTADVLHGTVAVSLPPSFTPASLEVPVKLQRVAWATHFGWLLWTLGLTLSAVGLVRVMHVIPKRFGVIWLTSGHGEPVALPRGGTVTVGGPGGLGPEDFPPVARLLRGRGTTVMLEPTGLPDTAVQLNGIRLTAPQPYTFGVPFLCTSGEREEQITITRAAQPRVRAGAEPSGQNLLDNDIL